jgi:transposase
MIGHTNQEGKLIDLREVQTTPQNLINQVVGIAADRKCLTIEQTNMAFAMAEQLHPYVDELIICEPHHNKLISQNGNKNDRLLAINLCRLLRLDELKPVWRPTQMGKRRLFYQQVKEYKRLDKMLTANRNQLQASLRHWGVQTEVSGSDYRDPSELLEAIGRPALRDELEAKIGFIRQIHTQKTEQFKRARTTGRDYPEIREFQKMTGIGPVGSHTFSGYIQTPHRFEKGGQLIRFCQLGICKRSSDGTPYGYEHLDKTGHSQLKQVSYVAWETAQKSGNEVSRFYEASLERSNNATNARLNTQRKIVKTLWIIWKNNSTYDPERFFSGDGNSAQ